MNVNIAWQNYLANLDQLITDHEKLKVEIADAINEGGRYYLYNGAVYEVNPEQPLPEGATIIDANWVANRHDLRASTWASYASTMRRFPKEKRPLSFSKLKISHYQAVDRAKLSELQTFQLLTEFLIAKERGGYADTENTQSLVPANVHELRRRAELEEKTNPTDRPVLKRGRPTTTLKTLRNYVGVNMPYTQAQNVAVALNQWLHEPIPFADIPQGSEITITVDVSYRTLDKE